jgi:hypothetical protein
MSKDVKKMVGEIRQSLDAYPREQLVEILSYVFKEYVVEGAAPIAGTTALIDARTELEGLSFAELVTWLQLHLDVPELAQLEVQGNRVSVRAGGRAVPIEAPRNEPPAAVAPPTPVQPTQPAPAPAAAQPAATPAPAATQPAMQRSQTQQPAQPAAGARPQPAQPNPPAAGQPQQQQQQQQGDAKEESGDPASRFSWLEVD